MSPTKVNLDLRQKSLGMTQRRICAQCLPTDELRQEWKCLAEFAKRCYRDIEIISINPVGLRGLFKDLDTNKEEE